MLVSSWNDLVKKFPELNERAEDMEVAALREYLQGGGVINVADGEKLKIVYPSRKMIDARIDELKRRRKFFSHQLEKLKRLDREFMPIKLAFDPLYYKHMMRMLMDRKYREAFEKLNFSWEHFMDPRTRKIIQAFMDNEEYRKNVLHALSESPVYKKRRFGSVLDIRRETRHGAIRKRMNILENAIRRLDRQMLVLSMLKRWM